MNNTIDDKFAEFNDLWVETLKSLVSSSAIPSKVLTGSVEDFIFWLFREKCVICHRRADVVHEIIPRSSGKDAMYWKNRVTLCNECHRQVHDKGIGDDEIMALQQGRIEFLEMVGREEYV